jgi:cation diffusion facilitator family transporter
MLTSQEIKYRWMSISFGLSIVLLLLKLLAYYLTSSTAILTDALESIVNVVASGFAFYSIYLSGLPRDENHPYGHGKIEFLSSGFEGALILSAGLFILVQAGYSFFEPKALENLGWGLALVAFTTAANALTGYALVENGKKTDSAALTADGQHLLTDSLSSLIVLIGVSVVWFTRIVWLDSVLSLALAGLIIFNGVKMVRQSVARLMDETDAPTLDRVVETLNGHKSHNWIDVHNLRVQKYGADLHVDCHLTLPYYWELNRVHDEVHQFEDTIKNGFRSEVEIFVHTDPCLSDCCHYCRVENCPVRAEAFQQDILWTSPLLITNQKHFERTLPA